MQNELKKILTTIVTELGVTGVEPEVHIAPDAKHGEYATNIALKLASQLKKRPMDIGLQVRGLLLEHISRASHEDGDQNEYKKGQKASQKLSENSQENVLQDIKSVEVVPPGFINISVSEAGFSTRVHQALNDKERFGTAQTHTPKAIVIEFTDPNPFKEFHIGHLYSNSVGEAISRFLESQGHRVRRVNYQGDVGMHVAKAMYGLLHTPNIETEMTRLAKVPLPTRAKFLGKAYAMGAAAFEENETAASEMKQLNKLLFVAAQRYWVKEKGRDPVIDYTKGEPVDETHLKTISELYETGRQWSLDYFETIYARLGTKFLGYYFESFVGERGAQMVAEHVNDGVFELSDGAIVYKGEKKGLHTRVFINALGLPTYEAKELGLAPTKYDDEPYDQSIIATGNEINEYFKVLLAALSEIAPDLASKTKHLGHGMVRKSDGSKMSSRSGAVLTGEGLLDEVKASIYKILDKNTSELGKDEYERIAETAAVAAVKYSLLRVSLPSDVSFDVATSVSFDGDSGPYLMYSYARAKSVLRKAGGEGSIVPLGALNDEERALARLIYLYPEIVEQAASDLSPSVLCTYLFKLAQAFNLFYQKHTILGSDRQNERLILTAAAAQGIKNGLHLLGIQTVEQM